MARCLAYAALAASAAAATLNTDLTLRSDTACAPNDLAMARLVEKSCHINWARTTMQIKGKPKNPKMWNETLRVGCWDLLAYNTDEFFSSTVYQRKTDHRCALVFSGFHGSLTGYVRAALALTYPLTTVETCGFHMYAPYVRLFRHHTALGNWSKLMHLIAGSKLREHHPPCKGEPMFAGESMGGSTGEILAACANAGRLDELMPKGMPPVKIQELYTFGSPAASSTPITNPLAKDECFKGKRIFFAGDVVAHVGTLTGMQHTRMPALEIWPSKWYVGEFTKPTARVIPCAEASTDVVKVPPPSKGKQDFAGERDLLDHSSTMYEDELKWFYDNGLGDLLGSDHGAGNPALLDYLRSAGVKAEGEAEPQTTASRYASEYDMLED